MYDNIIYNIITIKINAHTPYISGGGGWTPKPSLDTPLSVPTFVNKHNAYNLSIIIYKYTIQYYEMLDLRICKKVEDYVF